MISIDSREVDNDGGSDRDRDEDTDDEESMGTYPDTGRGRRYPSISDFPIASLSLVSRSGDSEQRRGFSHTRNPLKKREVKRGLTQKCWKLEKVLRCSF